MIYECHITIEPIIGKRLEEFRELCKEFNFKVANLYKQNGEISDLDSFATGHSSSYSGLENDMINLLTRCFNDGFKVLRYKIELILLDSKYGPDDMELLK